MIKYRETSQKKVYIGIISSSLIAIFANTLIILINGYMGPIYILCGSLLVFSLQSYLKLDKEDQYKENLLKSIVTSLKDRFEYDHDFLSDYSNAENKDNNYGELPFKFILNEDLFNHLVKLGFEFTLMQDIELIYRHIKNIIKYSEKISQEYYNLYQNGEFGTIIKYNKYIHAFCVYYYVRLFVLDEKINNNSNGLSKIGDLIDNKSYEDCLKIAKENKIFEKLKKSDEKKI